MKCRGPSATLKPASLRRIGRHEGDPSGAHDDLCWISATELASAIRSKMISPVEATKAVLARIDSVNSRINAFCTVAADRALAEAQAAESAVMKGDPQGALGRGIE
jgi:Asp-tRNA(Asn)/Glu-tRNA(Gln) amidotransferase A subunit family amidase